MEWINAASLRRKAGQVGHPAFFASAEFSVSMIGQLKGRNPCLKTPSPAVIC
jgi:hypothetical protein